jgi:hypothetical protein
MSEVSENEEETVETKKPRRQKKGDLQAQKFTSMVADNFDLLDATSIMNLMYTVLGSS